MPKKSRPRHALVKDWHLWSEVTRTVKPLPSTVPFELPDSPTTDAQKDLVKTVARQIRAEPKNKRRLPTAPSYSPPMSRPATSRRLETDHKSIEPGMRKRLVRGHIAIDGTIDLHGMRQDEAYGALIRFVMARFQKGDRTLLVITGKGLKTSREGEIREQGVLRHMLPRWLSEATLSPLIAGWQISAQGHGGEGAYYVRLRRGEQ